MTDGHNTYSILFYVRTRSGRQALLEFVRENCAGGGGQASLLVGRGWGRVKDVLGGLARTTRARSTYSEVIVPTLTVASALQVKHRDGALKKV